MKKGALVRTLGILLPCLLLAGNVEAAKNVLLLMCDDLNDYVGCVGGHPQVKTPNIDKFAKKAVVFRNAHCTGPVCLPSRTSMLTGLRPTTSKVYGNTDGFFRDLPGLADLVTLPQFFKNKGYFAASGGKIFHVAGDGKGGDARSWTEFKVDRGTRNPIAPTPDGYPHGMTLKTGVSEFYWGYSADTVAAMTDDWKSADYIANFLKKIPQGTNFFLGYGSSKPHHPWFAPKMFFDRFDSNNIILPQVLKNDLDDVPRPQYSNNFQTEVLRTNNWARAVHAYLACGSFADSCVGHVLTALEKSPYRDSTIVLIMGDHGWHNGEKEHWHKATLWEEAMRTFFIMYDPSIAKPGVVDQAVSLQDVYPTLLDLTGNKAAMPGHVAGRSLRPILENPQKNNFIGWALLSHKDGTAHTLRTDKWALIRYEDKSVTAPDYEFYNMYTDPLQWTNLAKDTRYADTIKKLSEDITRIINLQDPVNTSYYDNVTSVGTRQPRSRDKALSLPAYNYYHLRAYGVNGKLVREFQGKGPDIERMIKLGKHELGLPPGKYVYRVFDIKERLVQTVSSSWLTH